MTFWGGLEVQRFARDAGFTGDDVKRATAVSYAVSKFNDAHQLIDVGRPELDEWGLYGLSPSLVIPPQPQRLYEPRFSATLLFNLFGDSGQRWDFHSVVARNNGADVQRAWRVLTEHNLWERSADNMPPPTQPIGARFGRRSPYEIMRDADDLRSVL